MSRRRPPFPLPCFPLLPPLNSLPPSFVFSSARKRTGLAPAAMVAGARFCTSRARTTARVDRRPRRPLVRIQPPMLHLAKPSPFPLRCPVPIGFARARSFSPLAAPSPSLPPPNATVASRRSPTGPCRSSSPSFLSLFLLLHCRFSLPPSRYALCLSGSPPWTASPQQLALPSSVACSAQVFVTSMPSSSSPEHERDPVSLPLPVPLLRLSCSSLSESRSNFFPAMALQLPPPLCSVRGRLRQIRRGPVSSASSPPPGRRRQALPPPPRQVPLPAPPASRRPSPSPHRRPPLLLFLFFRDESSSGSLVPSVDRALPRLDVPPWPAASARPSRSQPASASPSSPSWAWPMGERPQPLLSVGPASFGPLMFFQRRRI